MADTQKSKGTQGGSSKQHAEAGKHSHQGSSRDNNAKDAKRLSRSEGSEQKSGNAKNR